MSALQTVEKVVALLDSVNWAAYGEHHATEYLSYIQGHHGDEVNLMDGRLGIFLEKVLGFTLNRDMHPQMTSRATGKRPDYIPDDTHLHPFVFDAKGTDTIDLGQHYTQIVDYMRGKGLRYGVLANMRDLEVYTLQTQQPEVSYSFSFQRLYQDYKQSSVTVEQQVNTQHFLHFVERFKRRELNQASKIQAIIEARHSTLDAKFDLDELVRGLHTIVANLHDDVRQQRMIPLQVYRHANDRKERIALEIDAIAREMNPTVPERHLTSASLKTFLEAAETAQDGQATDRYFYQVAYFTMTRILLARVWEDIGFIDQVLYDGGFKQWYEQYNQQMQRILGQAFHFARERYSWLYGVENNYIWYTPSENALIDVLYDLSRFDFRHLDADVLGAVYEAYLDRTDRKNKGQYYTPRPVVQFIWDRVGFKTPTQIFRFEGGEIKPRICLDFCTGSGGFLVEAARRIRETALVTKFDHEDGDSLKKISLDELIAAMTAITEGLRGSEINAFAYYLTEVNLLIQLTPIIAAVQKKEPNAFHFGQDYALSVIHQDSLKLHNREQQTFEGEEYKQRDEIYEQDRRRDIVNLEGYKREVYEWLKNGVDENRKADYVCSNPPYIGEKGHKNLFRFVRENLPYWQDYYQGKMDYLYWFIILGLSKLREGGRLSYITTSYWPTADGASKLRQYILKNARIVEMIDFGDTRIFSDAPGQHNLIFTLERCGDVTIREANRPRLVNVKHEFDGKTFNERLTTLLDHIQEQIDIGAGQSFEDDHIKVFWSPLAQSSLSDKPWVIRYGDIEGAVIRRLEDAGVGLSNVLEINTGVHSNADAVKRDDVQLFTQKQLENGRVKVSEGIYVLTAQERQDLHLPPEEQDFVKPTYKTSDISSYLILPQEELYLLYIDNTFDAGKNPTIMKHLQRFAPILEARLKRYGEKYPWYRLHRPHKREHYESEKLVAPRWGKHIDFAYEAGGCYENSDINIFVKSKNVPEDLKYFLALLNSRPLVFWMSYKGEFKGVSRQALLHDIPMRRIYFDVDTDGEVKRGILDNLEGFLETNNYDAAYTLLYQALSAKQEDVIHDGLVLLAEEIMQLKKMLTAFNLYFRLPLTHLKETDVLPQMELLVIVGRLPWAEQWSVGICIQNGMLTVVENLSGERDDFYFHRVKNSSKTSITLRAKGRGSDTLTLTGDPSLINYLKDVLSDLQDRFWRDVKKTLMPRDIAVFEDEVRRINEEVKRILHRIAEYQGLIDQIVLDLYGVVDASERELILKQLHVKHKDGTIPVE